VIHRVPEKNWYTKLILITKSILSGFLKFFHWHTLQKICYKMSLKIPPHRKRVATLPVKHECYKLAKPVLLRCELPETSCMAHNNCGKRIKLSFIDLNSQDQQISH